MGTGIKPTREQVMERIEYARELLNRQIHGGQIKRAMVAKFGPMHFNTVTNYLVRARKVMVEDLGVDKDQLRAQSIGRYETIAQDKECTPRERLYAQERIDKILGLETPTRIAHEGKDGGAIQIEDATERLSEGELRGILRFAETGEIPSPVKNGNGHTNGNGNGHACESTNGSSEHSA